MSTGPVPTPDASFERSTSDSEIPMWDEDSSVVESKIKEVARSALSPQTTESAKYDRQMIIDFGGGNTSEGLFQKALKRRQPLETSVISWWESIDAKVLLEKLANITPSSRLYIVGHNKMGESRITNDWEIQLTIPMIVDALGKIHVLKNPGSSRLKISLVCCQSALERSASERSFAEQLSVALDKEEIRAEVIGFTKNLQRSDGSKPYHKIVVGETRSKQPHTKKSFSTEHGITTVRDLYPEPLSSVTAPPLPQMELKAIPSPFFSESIWLWVKEQSLTKIDQATLAFSDMGKYDREVIVDLGSGNTSQGLFQKAMEKKPPLSTSILSWRDSTDPVSLSTVMKDVTSCSRIYLVGYHELGTDCIRTIDGEKKLTVSMIVHALKEIPALKASGTSYLKISLVCGNGALGASATHPSFAEQLSVALDKEGIRAEVIGFTKGLQRSDGSKPYHKIVTGETQSKRPQTKKSFFTENGTTTVKDLYEGIP